MLSLRSLFSRKRPPPLDNQLAVTPVSSRLADMVDADRRATSSPRTQAQALELERVDQRKVRQAQKNLAQKKRGQQSTKALSSISTSSAQSARKRIGKTSDESPKALAPGRTINSKTTEKKPAQRRATEKKATMVEQTSPDTSPDATTAALPEPSRATQEAVLTSLDALDLKHTDIAAKIQAGSLNRFKQIARSRKLSVALNKEKNGFSNEATQLVWEFWKEAETQALIHGVSGFKESLTQAHMNLKAIEFGPLLPLTNETEANDLAHIVRKLSTTLYRQNPQSPLPHKAIEYLKSKALI